MAGKFEIKKDKAGKFRFNLIAANGEIIASSEAYESKEACINGIRAVQKIAPTAQGALKRQISLGTILIVVIAFSAGVATGSYFGPLLSQNQIMSTLTNVVTVPTTPAQPSISTTSSSILYSSSTSTSQVRTSASQRPKWISSDTNVIPWTQASSYLNQHKTVEGTIVYTKVSGSNVFLDFHYPYQGYFYAYIPSASNFGFSPASFYLNKEVRVTGTIVLYKGSPEIIVNSPSQIEVAYMGFNYP
jgi:micrococcal nuclease